MRKLLVAAGVLAFISVMQVPAAAAEEIICGKILGSSAPTATTPGSFVIPKPGIPAPDGTYIAVPAGTQFSYESPPVWVCVRATIGGPVVPTTGWPPGTTHTFIAFVPPGSPGYRAEPAAAPSPISSPGTGGVATPGGSPRPATLPATSTAAETSLTEVALWLLALLALGGTYMGRRHSSRA